MALGWLLQFLKLKMIPWRKRIWLWGRIGTVKQLAAKVHSRWEELAGLLVILPCSALWLWLQFKNKAKFVVWLAVSNTEQVLQDKKGYTHFSGMKIYLIPLNTFFVVILHKYSREVLFSFPCPQKKKKKRQHIHSSQVSHSWWQSWMHMDHTIHTYDDRPVLPQRKAGILQFLQVCRLLDVLWTPLGDPGNDHWCQGVWSYRAGVSSSLLRSSPLVQGSKCGAKRNILYTQTWAIQKVVWHIIFLGEASWTASIGNRSWDELGFILQKNLGADPSAKIQTLEVVAVEIANFQMPLLHCLGDNAAFPVPASAGAVWARSDFGEMGRLPL